VCVVDYYSTFLEATVTRETTANKVTDVMTAMFSHYFLPRTLVFDNGPCFESEAFWMFLLVLGIENNLVTAYWLQENGAQNITDRNWRGFVSHRLLWELESGCFSISTSLWFYHPTQLQAFVLVSLYLADLFTPSFLISVCSLQIFGMKALERHAA
jgi:hypothetical protein